MSVDVDQRMLNAITRLFDEMYRQGYMDSYSIQQDGSLYEFLDKVSTPDKFGILTDDHTMSWFEYKLYINSRVYKWHYRKEMEGILDEIKNMRKTWQACVLTIAQAYYERAVEDFLKYGLRVSPVSISATKHMRVINGEPRILHGRDLVCEIQQMCVNLQRKCEAVSNDEGTSYKVRSAVPRTPQWNQIIWLIPQLIPPTKKDYKYDIWHR